MKRLLRKADKAARRGQLETAEKLYWEARSLAKTKRSKLAIEKRAWDKAGGLATAKLEAPKTKVQCPSLPSIHFGPGGGIALTKVALLKDAASCILKSAGKVTVEGHYPELGDAEFYLAVGQRRANAVLRQLKALGVPKDRMKTISYGAERLVCTERTLSCFAKNSRVELVR